MLKQKDRNIITSGIYIIYCNLSVQKNKTNCGYSTLLNKHTLIDQANYYFTVHSLRKIFVVSVGLTSESVKTSVLDLATNIFLTGPLVPDAKLVWRL